MTLIPRTAFGRADEPALLLAHSPTYLDDGEAYDFRARSNRFPPAGIGGEAAFYVLYLAINHEAIESPVLVNILIDDVALPVTTVVLASDGVVRKRTVLEVSLLQPIPGEIGQGLFAPRGCWFQVEVKTAFEDAAAFLEIDAAEVEIDVVREGKVEGANPA